jgi:hypothetical protein
MLKTAKTEPPSSTSAEVRRAHGKNHGLLPYLNTGLKTASEHDFTSKIPLAHIPVQAALIRTRLRGVIRIQQFLESPGEFLKIHVQRLHLAF